MIETTLISIAMATYNGERFIAEQLDSILTQSYKNIELIITDDGSTDGTIEIIKKFQKNDSRIKLYQNSKNLGFKKNFEKAISLCNGEYIALADQDDIWKQNKLTKFKDHIQDNLLIYSDAELIDDKSRKLNRMLIQPNKNLLKGDNNLAFLFDNCVSGNTLMFKKELIPSILPIPNEISYHDIWIAFIASTKGTITYTNEAMTYYRRYNEQITRDTTKIYKSFIEKLRQKNNKVIKQNQEAIHINNYILTLPFLNQESKIFLNLINEHYLTFEKGYFNNKLYKYLKKNKNTLFAIQQEHKRDRYARNKSMKLKLHQLLLFST